MKKDQSKELLKILRSSAYTKKQKRIAATKWRFNQLPDEYRATHKNEYFDKIKEMQRMDESEFEDLTSF